jgi:hypothetical protein
MRFSWISCVAGLFEQDLRHPFQASAADFAAPPEWSLCGFSGDGSV